MPSKIEAVVQKNVQPPRSTKNIRSLPKDTSFAQTFFEWLTSVAGRGRSKSQADQIVSRISKFLCVSNEDLIHDDIKDSDIDFSTGSTENIGRFMETMQTEWKLGNSGQISYMHALIDLMDFRKIQGVSSRVLQNFAVVEMFIKEVDGVLQRNENAVQYRARSGDIRAERSLGNDKRAATSDPLSFAKIQESD